MDLRQVQSVQSTHAERIMRLEKKQADDAALKSVWTSPFPSVLNGTPQQAPIRAPAEGVFDDFDDEHCQNLLGSLQLDAEEPVRRGASRANSVRFDVSATQGANWGHASRPSGDFGPQRPSSGFGSHPLERSLSHKSDGRHSSAHSVHSVHSGRTSSLGLSNHFAIGDPDESPSYDFPEPPPGLFVLGSVPTIIRCWLTQHFFHSALLYAVVCTGSQKSTVEYNLLKDLELVDQIQKDAFGVPTIRLPVYLPEAIVTQPTSRSNSPAPQLPTLTVSFEVTGNERSNGNGTGTKAIRVFLGSDTLRAHSADLLLSQNSMTIYADDRNKLSVPFVRPEDDSAFKNICTTNVIREKVSLKGTAAPFTPADKKMSPTKPVEAVPVEPETPSELNRGRKPASSLPPIETAHSPKDTEKSPTATKTPVESKPKLNGRPKENSSTAESDSTASTSKQPLSGHSGNRDSIGGIWSSWRVDKTSGADTEATKDSTSTSGYNKPGRGIRSMKVLKPSSKTPATNGLGRSVSGGTRTGHSYEPAPASPLDDGHLRRKSTVEANAALRWDKKAEETKEKEEKEKEKTQAQKIVLKPISGGKTSNPIGTASAFSWMKPNAKPAPAAAGSAE